MSPWLLAPGIIFSLAAIGLLIYTFANASIIAFGAVVIFGIAGGVLVNNGWHAINAKFAHKHQAIYRDLLAQGFKLNSDQVFVNSSYYNYTTEVDLKAGRCYMPFIARQDRTGIWRVALPSATDQRSVVYLSPADVAGVCA